jgi:DNA adenine methylase
MDYRESMKHAKKGDLVYCDPPYKDAQTILYRAQEFDLRGCQKTEKRRID